MMMTGNSMELYVHIPFCVRKCAYCDFCSFPADEETRAAYGAALLAEIRLAAEEERKKGKGDRRITSVFFGGGTPSVLDAFYIEEILASIRREFVLEEDAEITLEANPGTLTEEKLAVYRRAGVNRLSIGLQSADDRELKLLGRIHSFADFERNYRAARQAGFGNISVDLMAALPGQTEQGLLKSLEAAAELSPEHLSVYSLMIEEGTPFYERYHGKEDLLLPSEEEERAMYGACRQFLEERGWKRYEISNYAKEGRACRHNIGYWTGVPYLGFGISASSYIDGWRFINTSDLKTYLRAMGEGGDGLLALRCPEEEVTRERAMEEFMFLGLRMTEGVSEDEFRRRFGVTMEQIYGGVLERMQRQGLMEQAGERRRLTEEGINVSNHVMAEFLF